MMRQSRNTSPSHDSPGKEVPIMSGSKFVCAFLSLLLCFSFTPTSVFAQDTVAETSPNLSESTGTPASPDEVAGYAEADEPTEPPLPTAPEQPISPVDGALDDSGADEKSYNRLKPKMSPQASARLKSSFSLRTILRAVARKLTPFSSAPWKTWSCYAAS